MNLSESLKISTLSNISKHENKKKKEYHSSYFFKFKNKSELKFVKKNQEYYEFFLKVH